MVPRKRERRIGGTGALSYIGIGILVVAAGATSVFALTKNDDSKLAAIAADYTPPTLPESSLAPTTAATSIPPVASPSPTSTPLPTSTAGASAAPQRVVILGDAYAASGGASDTAHGFPALVGKTENWNVDVVSCSGAGYAATGKCGENYAGLIPQVVSADPSLVIVTGGRADTADYQGSAAAASTFFANLMAALPNATVYAVSPVWDATHAQRPLGVVQEAVQAAATAHGAHYLDIGEPLRDHPELVDASGLLPNDAGHAALASAIETALPTQ